MEVYRDTASVVRDRDRFVGVNRHRDQTAESCQGLVDRVVDDLENHVVQTGAIIGVTNVHSRTFPNGLKAL